VRFARDAPLDPARLRVVIPTLNEARHVEGVLEQILDDPLAGAAPVIVADGGSTDGTGDIVRGLMGRHPNLRLVHNPGRSQAAALNMMLAPEHRDAEILVRCDAHAAYPPRYVSRLAARLEERGCASVVVPMDARAEPGGGCFHRGLAWIADSRLGAGGSPHRGGTASGWVEHGHHAVFRMAPFRALGGYDTAFRTNEDAEYDRRLAQAGRRIWLESGIRIGYFPRRGPGALWRQYLRYGQGRARTLLKHRLAPAPRQAIPAVHVVLLALSFAALPLAGAWALAYPLLYGGAVAAVGVATALRRRSPCGLMAAPALATMHTAWGAGFLGTLLAAPLRRRRRAGMGADAAGGAP
jgi:succinoglycan biosynthesis protein ExoA